MDRTDDAKGAIENAFARMGHAVAPALIEPALRTFLWSYAHTKLGSLQMTGPDRQVPNSPTSYADPAFEGLLEYLRPAIESRTGLKLFPTYSYFRIYAKGAELRRHRDRPACEVSVSLNIGQTPDEPWPLFVEGSEGARAVSLAPGDALLYRGCDLPHWREPYSGVRLVQVFLHYVDAKGPNASYKFDKRGNLMTPAVRGDQTA